MPRYEYKCKKCDHQFEVSHSINDSIDSCESCGGEVRRVFHPVGIVFKGSGFYATDAKKPSNRPPAPSDSDFKPAKDSSDGNGDKKKDDKKPDKSDSTSK